MEGAPVDGSARIDLTAGKPPVSALVTGAGSGLGLEVAVALAERGCRVAAGLRDASRADALLARAREAGVEERLLVLQMDVTDPGQIASAVQAAESAFGGIDVLVNNAGYAAGGYTEALSTDRWRKQFEVNLFGAVETVRAVLPGMRARGGGLIVQIGSISGRIGLPGFAAYNASKFALAGWSEALRHELRPLGIDVVLAELGAYRTSIWTKGFADLPHDTPAAYRRQFRQALAYARRSAEKAPDPRIAARLIVRIAFSRSRRFRYPAGAGVRLAIAARSLLPWKLCERLMDAMLRKHD